MTRKYLPYRFGPDQRKLVYVKCLKALNVGDCYSRFKGIPQHWPHCPDTSAESLSRLLENPTYDQHSSVHTLD
jgi:hypothetical protein